MNRENLQKLTPINSFLCGCVVLSNLLVMTYGLPPDFAMLEELDIEIPGDDALWQAETESIWEMQRNQTAQSSTTSLREAVSLFFDGKSNEQQPEDCSTWSSFSISTVIHGVAIAIWFLTQGRQACSSIAQHGEPSDAETKRFRPLCLGVLIFYQRLEEQTAPLSAKPIENSCSPPSQFFVSHMGGLL